MAKRSEHPTDRATRLGLGLVAAAVAMTVLAIAYVLGSHAWDAFRFAGTSLATGSDWDPVEPSFGAWPFIFGTLFSSAIAIALAVPIGFLVALFLTELAPRWLRSPLGILVELLAGVPSIVFGMWGFFYLAPKMHETFEPWVLAHAGWIPIFGEVTPGVGFLLAGLVLAIMILPTITAISRDALLGVPRLEREAAYALGATRWEVARTSLRSAKAGLFAAATLGLGRALGETIAVTLVIGNVAHSKLRLFDQGATLASTLANQVGEASDPLMLSALIALGFILFLLTLVVNLGARLVIERPWRKHA
ncbi:MAG: phosphate ABC transporter permease subunit PstC [Candidatus Thermoplasmatota archaeon]